MVVVVVRQPRIKDVLGNLCQTVSRKRASDLLHSRATSYDILFWTSRGQLLRDQRIIPVTNISEAKPRALNTFLDGLAELGVEKRLRKNKKTLSDLLEKEKENQEGEFRKQRGTIQTVEKTKKQLLRRVSPKSLKAVIRIRIATLKVHHSYMKRIRIRVNTVKAQMFIVLRS